ncbi:MAG: hypothetical protein H6739_00475 [Alphaproteobacteria bacterium]|nr:hypothetical protein [Alphaproteobacteria bacterium]
MSGYEVEVNGEIERIDDLETLLRMARSGQLRAEQRVRKPPDSWLKASALPELAGAFEIDVWGAWDELDDPDAELPTPRPPLAELPEDEPSTEDEPAPAPARPVRQVVPMTPRPRPQRRVAAVSGVIEDEPSELPEVDVEPLLEEPRPQPEVVRPMGEVIAFPGPRAVPLPVTPLPRLDPEPRPVPVARPSAKEVKREVPGRYWAMGAVLVVAATLTAGWVWYVKSLAGYTSPRGADGAVDVGPAVIDDPVEDPPVVRDPGSDDPVAPSEPLTPSTPNDAESDLLAELRAQLSAAVPDLHGSEDALSDALFVDLQRLASVRRAKADVILWSDGDANLPQLVELHIVLNDSGDPLRDIAAAGLVAGKYIHQFDLQVRRLEVAVVYDDGTSKGRNYDPKAAAELYTSRGTLRAFALGEEP